MRIHNGLVFDPDLLAAATAADGVAPLSEQFLRGLEESRGHSHLTALSEDQVVGLAAFDGATTELVVHPAFRRRGIATALVTQLAAMHSPVRVWAHGDIPAARAVAARWGWASIRELLVMGVELQPTVVELPQGMDVMNLEDSAARFGRDAVLDAWLVANNEAFSWHPEQGGWDRARLEQAMAAQWFNPADVLLLWDGAQLVGFHWTKRHDATLGEVYVVGLSNGYRGHGLGGPLVQVGLNHLAGLGMKRVILYVEADNVPAVAAYEKLGFNHLEKHVLYGPEEHQ